MTPAGSLSRRDRAAMVLAYECCREDNVHPVAAVVSARRALSEGDDAAGELLAASCCISAHENGRLALARMALALRVLLRADAGDMGPRARCGECGSASVTRSPKAHAPWCYGKCGKRTRYGSRRYRALWLDAPPHAAPADRRDDSAARAAGGEAT